MVMTRARRAAAEMPTGERSPRRAEHVARLAVVQEVRLRQRRGPHGEAEWLRLSSQRAGFAPAEASARHAGSGSRWRRRLQVRVLLRSLFLPEGYPDSVSDDYLGFQVWDTIQAMCSYLRGMLCTQAFLVGAGVGKESASATSAAVQWFFKDGLGMLGGMLFAWSRATNFGTDVKKWRFFADCINDVGLTIDMVAPLFPSVFLLLASLGSVCRAMCGVAAGSTRAALSTHFARRSNVSDISAKEGIQETAVTLCGLVLGIWVANALEHQQLASWLIFVSLTALHVFANYRALAALKLRSLNRQRASLVIDEFLRTGKVSSPAQVAARERIFWFGAMAAGGSRIELGASLDALAVASPAELSRAASQALEPDAYVLAPARQNAGSLAVALREGASSRAVLGALFHAMALQTRGASAASDTGQLASEFAALWAELPERGWDAEQVYLEEGEWRFEWD
jgi:hypothetical protein